MSGGQLQRVMIAMAIATNPALLIADEPTSSLDTHLRKQILCLLKAYQTRSNCGILLISHDLLAVKNFADKVVVINDGGLMVENGYAADIFAKPNDEYTKRLLSSLLTLETAAVAGLGLKEGSISGEEEKVNA